VKNWSFFGKTSSLCEKYRSTRPRVEVNKYGKGSLDNGYLENNFDNKFSNIYIYR
jgi:hypothetical protein